MSVTRPKFQFPSHFWFRLAVGLTFFTVLLGLGVFWPISRRTLHYLFPCFTSNASPIWIHKSVRIFRSGHPPVINATVLRRPDFILETKSADLLLRFLINLRNPSSRELFKPSSPALLP